MKQLVLFHELFFKESPSEFEVVDMSEIKENEKVCLIFPSLNSKDEYLIENFEEELKKFDRIVAENKLATEYRLFPGESKELDSHLRQIVLSMEEE